jgi:mannosyltransferase OCH1-like enzyme
MEKFREINPDLHFVIYDTEQSNAFMRSYYKDHEILKIYEKSLAGPLKADIFRYCILYQYGGFYCDINKALTRPFSSFIQESDTAVISYETNYVAIPPDADVYKEIRYPDKYVLQCVFGFQKNHIILQKMIENICTYYPFFAGQKFPKAKPPILSFTGPGMFTKVVRENVLGSANLRQVEIDFDDTFIFNLPGANVLYLNKTKYTGLTAYEIVRA